MADLGSSRIFGKLTVVKDLLVKAGALFTGQVEAASFKGDGSALTGTSNLRATGTTKADVGLGNVDNYSRAHYDGRYLGKTAKAADSDKLDGQDGSYYRNASNLNAGTVPAARLPNATATAVGGVKVRLNGTTAYITSNGNNA